MQPEGPENLSVQESTTASIYKSGKDSSTLYCSVHVGSNNGQSICTSRWRLWDFISSPSLRIKNAFLLIYTRYHVVLRFHFILHRHRPTHLKIPCRMMFWLIYFLKGVVDVMNAGETRVCRVGKRIVLPRIFPGGDTDMQRRFLGAMAIVQRFGEPDYFITMTCKPHW